MTPFEKAGYTKDTKFKVLVDYDELRVGDIVTICKDDGSTYPYFKTEDGRTGEMCLPSRAIAGYEDDLEVYEEPNKLTPFEEAGYTEDTKFKVLARHGYLRLGDIVTLDGDDGTESPCFKTEDGRTGYIFLPGTVPNGELDMCEEDSLKKENVDSVVPPSLTIPRTNIGTTKIYLSDSIELPNIDSDENGTYVEINNEVIVNAYRTLRDSVI